MYFVNKYVLGKLIVRHIDFCLFFLWARYLRCSGGRVACTVTVYAGLPFMGLTQHNSPAAGPQHSQCFSPQWSQSHMVLCTAIRSLFCLVRFIFFTSVALSISHQRPAAYLCEAHIWSGFGIFNQQHNSDFQRQKKACYNWWVPGLTLTLLLVFFFFFF